MSVVKGPDRDPIPPPVLEERAMMSHLPSPPLEVTLDRSLPGRFRRLAAEWKEQSRFLSNSAQMAMLRPYQRIIGMGPPAVPLILEELRREPGHWFWSLEAITEEDPVPPEAVGKVRLMARAWIRWGEEQGLIGHEG
jgi:hypothetical protein